MIYNATKYNTGWNTRKLNELGEFSRGKSKHRPRNDPKLFEDGKYPLVQTGDIKASDLYIINHAQEYGEFGLRQSKLWDAGTLCITIAANIAETSILKYPMCFPDSVVGFNAYTEETSELFMHYVFTYIRNSIQNSVRGSIQDNINIEYLSALNFKVPEKSYQDKIVLVLSLLDRKILLNKRANAELERIIKTFYDYWFVQFDFPDNNGMPYRTSGGEMEWNDQLKNEIPKGWDSLTLSKRFAFERGIEVGAKNYSSTKENGFVPFYRVSDVGSQSFTYVDSELLDNKLLEPSDVCVTFDGTLGKVDFGLSGGFSTGLRKIYDLKNEIKNSVIYSIFKSDYAQIVIRKYATGSNILHSSESINNLYIAYDQVIYKKFQDLVTPFFEKMLSIKKENIELAKLRDWLLPMLMNGQATVE